MLKEVTPEQKRQIIIAYDDGMKAALNSVLEYFPEDIKAVFKRQLVDDAEMIEANDYFKCNFVCNDDIEEAEILNLCTSIKTGETFEYYIIGLHGEPSWYNNSYGFFNDRNGDILVYNVNDDEIIKFNSIDQFHKEFTND